MKDRFKILVLRFLFILNIILLIGCSDKEYIGRQYLKPNQEVITSLIWNQGYQQSNEPPEILWVEKDLLNCTGKSDTSKNDGWRVKGKCVDGRTYVGDYITQIAYPNSTNTWANLSIVHEFCHIWAEKLTGDQDANHLLYCNDEGLNIMSIRQLVLNNGY